MTFLLCSVAFIAGVFIGFATAALLCMSQDGEYER